MDDFIRRTLVVLVPSYAEMQVSLAAAVLVVVLYCFLQHVNGRVAEENAASSVDLLQSSKANIQTTAPGHQGVGKLNWRSSYVYVIKLELLAAKNLIGANLNGTSDPYAIMTCGSQKRFSSLVQGSRNPMWGEEFDFFIEELPAQISLAIYDWDIIRSSTILGSMTLEVKEEGDTDPLWYTLDSTSGQVCLRTNTKCYPVSASGTLNGFAGAIARRKLSQDRPVATEVRTKPGPLQTIFGLPPDEVVKESYSCAMERSFLYHGRMYVSTFKICFHSNIFAKQMKVVLPIEDVAEINRSQHAFINPAITIILRSGSGGHGVPPLASADGRAKYKFASFWNRNHALRILQRAQTKFDELKVQAKQERQQSDLRAHSSSFKENVCALAAVNAECGLSNNEEKGQPFIKDDVLVDILQARLPCTAEDFFKRFLSDQSTFTAHYRAERKDYDLKVELWHTAEQYSGLLRKMTMRSVCSSPMCPPDTALTELQHAFFKNNKKTLVLETVQQAHDVPFGSYFEVHARWTFTTTVGDSSCTVDVKVGAHFNKWLPMQQKIRAGTVLECTKDAKLILKLAGELLSSIDVPSPGAQEHGRTSVAKETDGKACVEFEISELDIQELPIGQSKSPSLSQ